MCSGLGKVQKKRSNSVKIGPSTEAKVCSVWTLTCPTGQNLRITCDFHSCIDFQSPMVTCFKTTWEWFRNQNLGGNLSPRNCKTIKSQLGMNNLQNNRVFSPTCLNLTAHYVRIRNTLDITFCTCATMRVHGRTNDAHWEKCAG